MGAAIAVFVLLGSFLAVPAVLQLADPFAGQGSRSGRWLLAWHAWLPAAVCLAVAFAVPAGVAGALLALPWLLFTGLVALLGVLRAAERGGGPLAEVAVDAGLVYLAIGGVWTFASRAGLPVLGFTEPWVGLTAAHFHWAGPVLPVVTGQLARRRPGPLGEAVSLAVTIGVPLVALGITAGHGGARGFELAMVGVLTAGALGTVWLLVLAAQQPQRLAAKVALAAAGCALAAGMTLAVLWAFGNQRAEPFLSLETMVWTHAPLQVFGFALPALWALGSLPPLPALPAMEVLLPWLGDRPREDAWQGRAFTPEVTPGAPGVCTDRHAAELAREPPGAPAADGPFARAAAAVRSYRSFPPTVLEGLRPAVPVTKGEIVRARYRLLPFVHIVFAARVTDVFDEVRDGVHRTGFTYRTLDGHPEWGVETFAVEKELATGVVRGMLFAHSRCGTAWARALRPLCRRLQLAAGRAAVANLRLIAGNG